MPPEITQLLIGVAISIAFLLILAGEPE